MVLTFSGSSKFISETFNRAKYLSLSFGGLTDPDTVSPVLILNFLISTCQVILGWATRLKIIDPDSKQDVGDEIVGHVFVIIAIILIYRLSDIIYV